jgi:CHAD domain-containing protein
MMIEGTIPPDPSGAPGSRPLVSIVALTPAMRSADALKKIHRELLHRIRENDDSVRSRLPGEYLHDFRVAVRRTRTGLRQLKHVYPADATKRFTNDFGWLSSVTGPARDLEVFLASIEEHRGALGGREREALQPFVDFLKENEDQQRSLCSSGLGSDRYRSLIRAWEEFLYQPADEEASSADASRPVRELAARAIAKSHRRIVRRGRELGASSPAAVIHRLRLDGKKLRYLLEFFGDLFDEQVAARAVAALRHTQDSLGRINDLGVQIDWLRRFSGAGNEAMPALRDHLEKTLRVERRAFLESFASFLHRDGPVEVFARSLSLAP